MALPKFEKSDKAPEENIRETARAVALATDGVSSLPPKGIKIERASGGIVINVNINVEYGQRIPEVAFDTQENVKKAVSGVTELKINKVNVNIQGVEECAEQKQESC